MFFGGRFVPLLACVVALVPLFLLMPSSPAGAADCKVANPALMTMMVDHNIASLQRKRGNDAVVSGLRAKVDGLKASGRDFASRANTLTQACQALASEWARVKQAHVQYEASRKPLLARLQQIDAQGRQLTARDREIKQAAQTLHGLGCGMGNKLPPDKYAFCKPRNDQFNAQLYAYRAQVGNYRTARATVVAQIKQLDDAYRNQWNAAKAHETKLKADYQSYQAAAKAWEANLKQVWGESTQAFSQAPPKTATTTARPQGGELGKLSGPFASGNPSGGAGTKPLPGAMTVPGEGGAKGQARAAAMTGQLGAGAGSGAEAAHQAGRVFDRGDVKVGGAGSGGVVDARGVTPRAVPEKVRQTPQWQALDSREQGYRTQQAEVQKKIDTIQKQI